jgi:hypothetical protein
MTSRALYEAIQIELRKTKAPHLHIEDMLYFINKGITDYVNIRYANFAITQQFTDDLQALTTSATLIFPSAQNSDNFSGSYTPSGAITPIKVLNKYASDGFNFLAPRDYLHFTGANLTLSTKKHYLCYPKGTRSTFASKRLTPELANGIINNAYLRPSFGRVYHTFENSLISTEPQLTFFIGSKKLVKVEEICIDYLKKPQVVVLDESELLSPIDTSQSLEFSDYICNEIVKRVVMTLLENTSNPRVQSHPPVNTTIK